MRDAGGRIKLEITLPPKAHELYFNPKVKPFTHLARHHTSFKFPALMVGERSTRGIRVGWLQISGQKRNGGAYGLVTGTSHRVALYETRLRG